MHALFFYLSPYIVGCIELVGTNSLLPDKPIQRPNNKTSSLCSWIRVCSPTAFLSVALLYNLFTGGIPNLPVNSFLSPWMCNSTMMAANNDQHKAHTQITANSDSEMQPISERICSFVIMDNNTTLGTDCYTILRPAVELSRVVFCTTKQRKKSDQKSVTFNQ